MTTPVSTPSEMAANGMMKTHLAVETVILTTGLLGNLAALVHTKTIPLLIHAKTIPSLISSVMAANGMMKTQIAVDCMMLKMAAAPPGIPATLAGSDI